MLDKEQLKKNVQKLTDAGAPEQKIRSYIEMSLAESKPEQSLPQKTDSSFENVGDLATKFTSEFVPFGIGKPLASGLAAVGQKYLPKSLGGGDERPIGDIYKQNRQIYEQAKGQFEQDNPELSMAITGSSFFAPTGISKIPGVVDKFNDLTKLSEGAKFGEKALKTVGKYALPAALSSGATNYITSDEEDPKAALANALTAAGVGGVIGTTLGPTVGAIANRLSGNYANKAERQFSKGLADLSVGMRKPIMQSKLGDKIPETVNDITERSIRFKEQGLPTGLAYIARDPNTPDVPNAFISQKLSDIQGRGITPDDASLGAKYTNQMNEALRLRENELLPNIGKSEATDSLIESAGKRIEQTKSLKDKASKGFELAKTFDDLPEVGQERLNNILQKYPFAEDYLIKSENAWRSDGVEFPTYGQKLSLATDNMQKRIDQILTGNDAGIKNITGNKAKINDIEAREIARLTRAKTALTALQEKYDPSFKQAMADYRIARREDQAMGKTGTTFNVVKKIADMAENEATRPQALGMVTRLDQKGLESLKQKLPNGNEIIENAFLSDLRDRVQRSPAAGSKLFEQGYILGDKEFTQKLKYAISPQKFEGLKQFYRTKQDILNNSETIPNFIISAGKNPEDKGLIDALEAAGYAASGSKQVTASKSVTAIKKAFGLDNTSDELKLLFDSEKGQQFLNDLASGKFSDIQKREQMLRFLLTNRIAVDQGQTSAEMDNKLDNVKKGQ